MPRAAVIIPTLLGGEMLELSVQALSRQSFRDFEIIIVNNGAERCPEYGFGGIPLRVINAGSNLGFGGGINLGIAATGAEFIATLNDDTEADPEWLRELVEAMDKYPEAGMCASAIRLFRPEVDSAGMSICFDGSSKQRGGAKMAESFCAPEEVLLPSACAALYRRQLLDEIGLFDADFFLYCEDTDLGLRAQWAGWVCRYVPGAKVRHRYSATARAFSRLKARYVERNRLWVAIKCFPAALLVAMPFVSMARYGWQAMAVRQGKGAAAGFTAGGESLWSAAALVAGAWRETFAMLPELLRKRRAIQAGRRITTSQFISLLRRHRISAKELAFA